MRTLVGGNRQCLLVNELDCKFNFQDSMVFTNYSIFLEHTFSINIKRHK